MGRNRWGLACGLAAATLTLGPAGEAVAAVPHVVQPGETLWSISAANNFTTRTVAAFNGLPEDGVVIEGATIQIPTVEEGSAVLAAAGTPAATASPAPSSGGGAAHVVQPGETLWSISMANNLTTRTVAAFNGLSEDAMVIAGETIQIPTVEQGAAALAAAGDSSATTSDPAASAGGPPAPAPGSTYGLGHIPSPYGELHLDPAAADSWNAMREEAMATYGVDIYPGGPVSAFRTSEQQAYLYDLYLSGQGAPANPPGTSSHELGGAVDLETPDMRSVIDSIGSAYGWYAPYSSEWWHVEWGG